ncbi:hypothetical protein [Bacillus sp. FJAT-28004]|uniref:hypothetical protein n=1 Tax=Bacillus sp. FJAT-28004 TaxID=1679165 RepID=UPI0006B65E02|nr:hypothetical protein [Bacillus sp. FJAT-28004]
MTQQTIRWISSTETSRWRGKAIPAPEAPKTSDAEAASLTITLDTFQTVEGFGGCFNEQGFTALGHLREEQRAELLHSLFHPEGDHRFTICRLPIGASDYALD